ncbi:hypothetical protein QJS04_geneDACA001634 [Acorus gramineus]|uniref:Uncharacterized protein n=1 Tax=Acorus gramineus TaxID=55184 RepID=A0AAV9BHY4_ACOGR|nr:hypothetical protein QJS04_geneDACA001634 [Acorus gramineus]
MRQVDRATADLKNTNVRLKETVTQLIVFVVVENREDVKMDNYEAINGGHRKKWIPQTFPLEACRRVVLVASGTSKSKCKSKHTLVDSWDGKDPTSGIKMIEKGGPLIGSYDRNRDKLRLQENNSLTKTPSEG